MTGFDYQSKAAFEKARLLNGHEEGAFLLAPWCINSVNACLESRLTTLQNHRHQRPTAKGNITTVHVGHSEMEKIDRNRGINLT